MREYVDLKLREWPGGPILSADTVATALMELSEAPTESPPFYGEMICVFAVVSAFCGD
jgi:hypothetical protein